MKPYYLVVLFIAIAAGLIFMRSNNSSNVLGTNIVGNESNEICWHGTMSADAYQVYYGQASTGSKDSTIFNGLDGRSKCVKLYYLKPCTTYIWNLLRNDGGKWSWQWEKDQRFVTGGTCDVTQPITPIIVGDAQATATWTVTNGATKYYIFYKGAGDTNWTHSAEVSSRATNYTINYLDPNRSYLYRVAALVDGKLIWQEERNLILK